MEEMSALVRLWLVVVSGSDDALVAMLGGAVYDSWRRRERKSSKVVSR